MNPQPSHPPLGQPRSSNNSSTGNVPSLVRYSEDGYRPWVLFLIIIVILVCVTVGFFLTR